MKVFVLMPTACAPHTDATVAKWKAKGYAMATFQDPGSRDVEGVDVVVRAPYPGVWNACNALAQMALSLGADVCLFAGDDMDPDPNHTAQEIGAQYLERFPDGYGVMQPCGDMQGVDASGRPAAARICGSAWFGRRWVRESYGGRGPTPGEYFHLWGDEDLKEVAERLGVLWWRPDLMQFHRHYTWGWLPQQKYHERPSGRDEADRQLFLQRKAAGFPA